MATVCIQAIDGVKSYSINGGVFKTYAELTQEEQMIVLLFVSFDHPDAGDHLPVGLGAGTGPGTSGMPPQQRRKRYPRR